MPPARPASISSSKPAALDGYPEMRDMDVSPFNEPNLKAEGGFAAEHVAGCTEEFIDRFPDARVWVCATLAHGSEVAEPMPPASSEQSPWAAYFFRLLSHPSEPPRFSGARLRAPGRAAYARGMAVLVQRHRGMERVLAPLPGLPGQAGHRLRMELRHRRPDHRRPHVYRPGVRKSRLGVLRVHGALGQLVARRLSGGSARAPCPDAVRLRRSEGGGFLAGHPNGAKQRRM